jgi:hypothetical protein
MFKPIRLHECACALALAACVTQGPAEPEATQAATVSAVTAITGSYWGNSLAGSTCDTYRHMIGYQPVDAGTYPVFVYTLGFGGQYDDAEGDSITKTMAAKGYVAVSIEYDNLGGIYNAATGTAAALGSTQCAFRDDGTASAWAPSAVDEICYSGHYNADCTKGVVVGGMSLGTIVALRAANVNPNVRAAWIMGSAGGSDNADLLADPQVCNGRWNAFCGYTRSTRALPSSRLRNVTSAINGSSIHSPNPDPTDCSMYMQTGIGHPDPLHCQHPGLGAQNGLAADGHGWYLVEPSEVSPGNLDTHCYYQINGCSNQPVTDPTFDPLWFTGSALPWALDADLSFLDQFVTH